MAITYKTVIARAINHFNAIQNELSMLKAKYNNAEISLTTANDTTLIPTAELSGIIKNQLQLKSVGNLELTAQTGTDVSAYATASVRSALGFSLDATDNTTSDVTVGTLTSGYYPLTNSIKATLTASTAGWFTSGEATDTEVVVGRIAEAKFDVSGNVVYCKTAGYVPQGSASSALGTIAAGSVTSSATITATTLEAGSKGITLLNTAPAGTAESDYFTLKPYATASSSMTLTAGYIASKGTQGGASKTNKTTYYVNASKETASTIGSYSFTPTLSNPKGTDGKDTATSGNVQLAAATGAIVSTEPTTGYYLKLNTDSDSDAISSSVTVSEGYTKGGTYTVSPTDDKGAATNNVVVGGTTNYVKIKSGAVDVTASKTYSIADSEQQVSVTGKTLTVTGSTTKAISLTRTEGYISGGTANSSTTVTLSNSKTIDLTKLDSNLIAANIKSGTTIFGITGTLSAGAMLPELDMDALASHILVGYKAYDESGNALTGTMADYSTLTTDKNGAGVYGSGREIGSSTTTGYTPTLLNDNGTYYLKSYVNNTGYVKANTTYMTSTVPTQAKEYKMPITNEEETIYPDSGYLLKSLTVKSMDEATWNDAKITSVTGTKTAISGTNITDIKSDISFAASDATGYLFKVTLSGSAAPTVKTEGHVDSEASIGTVSIDDTMTFKVASSTVNTGTYLTTDTTLAHSTTAAVTKGYVGNSYYVKKGEFTLNGVSGSVSITNNSTSPTASGHTAKVYEATDTNKANGDYVLIKATGSATGNKVSTAGWFSADPNGTTVSNLSDNAIIKAAINPEFTANGTGSATVAVGSATTFDSTTGTASAGAKTNKANITGSVSGKDTTLQDKYIIGSNGVAAKGTVSGEATANINADATGATVDTYVEALFKRMLGQTYTAVDPDPAS